MKTATLQPIEDALRQTVMNYFGMDPLVQNGKRRDNTGSYKTAWICYVVLCRQLLELSWRRVYQLTGVERSVDLIRLTSKAPESLQRHLWSIVSGMNGSIPYLDLQKKRWLEKWSGQTTLFPDEERG